MFSADVLQLKWVASHSQTETLRNIKANAMGHYSLSASPPPQTYGRKPSFKKNFAVGFPTKAEWKTGDVFQDYNIVFFTDGSKMFCGLVQEFSWMHIV